LNGEVTKKEGIPFAEGRYCEVWIGLWNRSGGQTGSEEEIGKQGSGAKKVSVNPTISITWMQFSVGGFESG
jgi:hypothetical protein